MKRGFTLIEMLIVIGILGILSAIMIGALSGATESARTAKCLANMRTIGQACQTYATVDGEGGYPGAGSYVRGYDTSDAGVSVPLQGYAWISGQTRGVFVPGAEISAIQPISMFETQEDLVTWAYTNGVVWRYIGADRRTYCCPQVLKDNPRTQINWTYLMNAKFRCFEYSTTCVTMKDTGLDRVLMLSEAPFVTDAPSTWDLSQGSATATQKDAILQYPDCPGISGDGETIGCNHRVGNRWAAHVLFADLHIEKLDIPSGMTRENMRKLTKALCRGQDYSCRDGQCEIFGEDDDEDDD